MFLLAFHNLPPPSPHPSPSTAVRIGYLGFWVAQGYACAAPTFCLVSIGGWSSRYHMASIGFSSYWPIHNLSRPSPHPSSSTTVRSGYLGFGWHRACAAPTFCLVSIGGRSSRYHMASKGFSSCFHNDSHSCFLHSVSFSGVDVDRVVKLRT